jgi:hypothetical protein
VIPSKVESLGVPVTDGVKVGVGDFGATDPVTLALSRLGSPVFRNKNLLDR